MRVPLEVLYLDAKLGTHRVKGPGFQLVLQVADNGKCGTKVRRLVTAFSARRVQDNREVPGTPQRFHLANELIASHNSLSDENVRK